LGKIKNTKAKGSVLENEFKAYFEKWGYIVTRAAGSFGVDLVAIKKDFKPVLINVKWLRKYCGPAERQKLLDDAKKVGGIAVLAYKFIPRGKKRGKHAIDTVEDVKKRGVRILLGPLENNHPHRMDVILGNNDGPFSKIGFSSGLHPYIPPKELPPYSLPPTDQ
jgi:Holliday junction resolvase